MICEIIVTAKLSGVQCINPLNAHKVIARRKRYRKFARRPALRFRVPGETATSGCLFSVVYCLFFLCIIRRVLFKLQLETGHIINS